MQQRKFYKSKGYICCGVCKNGDKLKTQKEKIIDFVLNLLKSIIVGFFMYIIYLVGLYSISLITTIYSPFLSPWAFAIIELLTIVLRMSYIYWQPL